MEDLINYIKKTNVIKASSISKIKAKSKPHPNLSDYNGEKLKYNIREIIKSFNDYNLKLKHQASKLIKAQGNNIAKESIIISLRKDLNYHKNINKNYKIYKKYADEVCDYYKQNYEEIFQYKANLRYDLRDFVKLLDGYEDEIEKCKTDKEQMIKTSEQIIKFKKGEKEKMTERLRKINNDLEKQEVKLNNVTDLLNDYKSQNENYMKKLTISELTHMERYELLEDKYKRLVTKYDFYFDQELKRRKLELDYKDQNLYKEEEDIADLKLQDNLLKNLFLKNIANEIKKQIKEIETAHQKYAEEEEMIKLWGKAMFYKMKKRKMELEENQQKEKNNNTINYNTINNDNTINNNTIHTNTVKNLNIKNKNNHKFNNNISIQINVGNLRDSLMSTHKNTKTKMNMTTTGTD